MSPRVQALMKAELLQSGKYAEFICKYDNLSPLSAI